MMSRSVLVVLAPGSAGARRLPTLPLLSEATPGSTAAVMARNYPNPPLSDTDSPMESIGNDYDKASSREFCFATRAEDDTVGKEINPYHDSYHWLLNDFRRANLTGSSVLKTPPKRQFCTGNR
jgi:hypothetical protein